MSVHPLRKLLGSIGILGLTAGLLLFGCQAKNRVTPTGPAVPLALSTATPTVDLTPNCSYPSQTLNLPGQFPQFIVWASTGTPTPTPPPFAIPGVIRSQADWTAFCAYAGENPIPAPPVDFTVSMILIRAHAALECPTVSSLESLCRYADRYEVTIKVTGNMYDACPQVYLPYSVCVGYVVDQSNLPVTWLTDNQVVGIPFPTGTITPLVLPNLTPTPTPTP